MRATAAVCPNCGATLDIGESGKINYCTYCGSKIILEKENEYVLHHIDEAEVRRVEMEREVRMKELELEERRMTQEETERRKKQIRKWLPYLIWIGLSGAALLAAVPLGIVIALLGAWILFYVQPKRKRIREAKRAGKIRLTRDLIRTEGKAYKTVEKEFLAAGFRNVQSVNMGDLVLGLRNRPGTVVRISINGKATLKKRTWHEPDEMVVISYHGFPRR